MLFTSCFYDKILRCLRKYLQSPRFDPCAACRDITKRHHLDPIMFTLISKNVYISKYHQIHHKTMWLVLQTHPELTRRFAFPTLLRGKSWNFLPYHRGFHFVCEGSDVMSPVTSYDIIVQWVVDGFHKTQKTAQTNGLKIVSSEVCSNVELHHGDEKVFAQVSFPERQKPHHEGNCLWRLLWICFLLPKVSEFSF